MSIYFFVYKLLSSKLSAMNEISETAYIVSPLETLGFIADIIKQGKSGIYLRFGDGDVYLSLGKDDAYQSNKAMLRKEMNECFSLKGRGILKSLSIHSDRYGREKEMYPGNHLTSDEAATGLLKHVYPFFVGYRIFSPIALHYTASYHPAIANDFLKLLKNEAVLFIGNENTPAGTVRKLFGEVRHVKTPAKNSYDKIDVIEKETEDILNAEQKFGVVIISMGCSGRILLKRLHKKGYNIFFFDFGSLLDGICGNKTRAWLELSDINYDVLLKDL